MSLVNTLTNHWTFEAVAEDGIPIAYEDLGCGEPLVLLQGVTVNSESWREASAAFAGLEILAIGGTLDPPCEPFRDFAQLAGGEFLPHARKNHVTAFLDVDAVVPAVDAFPDRVGVQNKGQGG
jgi:hypothetical protein